MKKGQPATAEGHAAPRDRVRPEQQVGALPARRSSCSRSGAPRRRSAEFEIAERLQAATGTVTARGCRRAASPCCVLLARGRRAAPAAPTARLAGDARRRRRTRRACARRRSTAASTASASSSRPTAPASRSLDYDNDGWLDALVLSGTRLRGRHARDAAYPPAAGADQPPLPQPPRRHVRGRHRRARACAGPAGPRASARATTTTTAGSICSSPTTAQNVLYRNRGDGASRT